MGDDRPVTILFTDFEGSTNLHTRLGDEQARKVLDGYDQLINEVVGDHGGRTIKNLGDGVLVAFESARRAVEAAVAIQRAVTAHAEADPAHVVGVRIGLNTGEVIHKDGDVFGSAVNAAARIMANATGGQILVADVVRQLTAPGSQLRFHEWGRVGLRGLAGEWVLHEVVWKAGVDIPAEPAPLPSRSTIVGREEALRTLEQEAESTRQGRGALVLIAGEPGIGKTALAQEVADREARRGACVSWGTCWDGEGAPAYWPWVQVIRSYVDRVDPTRLARHLGSAANEVARLVPEVAARVGVEPASTATVDPEHARFQLFDAVTSFLCRAAGDQPVVIVLDDLQWADAPSLLLLDFLSRQLKNNKMLVIGTYRDVEASQSEVVGPLLHDLARLATTISLGGLDRDDVRGVIARLSGSAPTDDVVDAVHRRTGGNPFFVRELTRLLRNPGAPGATVPEGVREVVERRLAHLSEPCVEVLTTAAVVGQEVGVDVLGSATSRSVTELLDVLDEAVRARVLAEPPGILGPYRFAHDLFRESLYDGLTPGKRGEAHARVAESLEAVYGSGAESHAAELARHWVLSLPVGRAERAVDWSLQAAQLAMGQLAYEEAATHYKNAVEADELAHAGSTTQTELLLGLAEAHRRAGDGRSARSVLARALEVARRVDAPQSLAMVVLAMDRLGTKTGVSSRERQALYEEALAGLGNEDSPLRARLLAALARHLYHSWGHNADAAGPTRARVLGEEALRMARRTGDEPTVAIALAAHHDALWAPGMAADRLQIATEMGVVTSRTGDQEAWLEASLNRFSALLELGDSDAFAEFERYRVAAERLRLPRARYYVLSRQATLAMLAGEFAEAETLIEEAARLADEINEPDGRLVRLSQLVMLRTEQGRRAELMDEFPLYGEHGWPDTSTIMRGLALAEAGATAEAAATLAPFDNFRHGRIVEYGTTWSAAIVAEVNLLLVRPEALEQIYEVLLPYTGTAVIVAGAVQWCGAVDHHLARIAEHLGRREQALEHCRAALEMEQRLGARPRVARSQAVMGRLLGEDGAALLAEAAATAEELGMLGLQRELAAS